MKNPAQKSKNSQGAVICGAYGFCNAGDDAVLGEILRTLRETEPDLPVCVLSRNPRQTAEEFGVEAIPMLNLRQAGNRLRRARLYISGGGSLLQNATSSRSLLFYLTSMVQAKCCGCRVLLYGCGIGPIRGKLPGFLTARILNACADAIALRDSASARTLKALGVRKRMAVTADPALETPADRTGGTAWLREQGLDPAGSYAAFCLRPWKGIEERKEDLHRAAAYVWKTYGLTPVFLPMNPREDCKMAEKLCEGLEIPHILLPGCGKPEILCAVLGRMRLVISMRLHGLIFAFSQQVPAVGISYDPKVRAFLEDTGNRACVELEHLSGERLCREIDRAMASPVPDPAPFRKKAKETGALAAALLK